MFGLIAAICFAVAFILHWAGGGHNPVDPAGLGYLGLFFLALHLLWPWTPWNRVP